VLLVLAVLEDVDYANKPKLSGSCGAIQELEIRTVTRGVVVGGGLLAAGVVLTVFDGLGELGKRSIPEGDGVGSVAAPSPGSGVFS